MNNAVKFTEQGYVHVNVSLEDRNNRPYIRFDVEDTGIGISPDKQGKIFEPFVQADGSTTRKYGGTGLGLTITKQLTELLGGQLSFTSQEGKGSIFSLVIPADSWTFRFSESICGGQDLSSVNSDFGEFSRAVPSDFGELSRAVAKKNKNA